MPSPFPSSSTSTSTFLYTFIAVLLIWQRHWMPVNASTSTNYTQIDDSELSLLQYRPNKNWNHKQNNKDYLTACYNHSLSSTSTPGASINVTFRGSSIAVYAYNQVNGAPMFLELDGVSAANIPTYNPSFRLNAPCSFWSKDGLNTDRDHILLVYHTNPGNLSATRVAGDEDEEDDEEESDKKAVLGIDEFVIGNTYGSTASTSASQVTSRSTSISGASGSRPLFPSSSVTSINSTLPSSTSNKTTSSNKTTIIASSTLVPIFALAIGILTFLLLRQRHRRKSLQADPFPSQRPRAPPPLPPRTLHPITSPQLDVKLPFPVESSDSLNTLNWYVPPYTEGSETIAMSEEPETLPDLEDEIDAKRKRRRRSEKL